MTIAANYCMDRLQKNVADIAVIQEKLRTDPLSLIPSEWKELHSHLARQADLIDMLAKESKHNA